MKWATMPAICGCVLALGAYGPALAPTQTAPPRYDVRRIEPLPGCDVVFATGVDDQGTVSGYCYQFVPPGHANGILSRPFVWRDGHTIALPTPGSEHGESGAHGQALGINGSGVVVGTVDFGKRWSPAAWPGPRFDHVTRITEDAGWACAMNRGRAAVGILQKDARIRAALWRDGRTTLLDGDEAVDSEAKAINDTGAVVGHLGAMHSEYDLPQYRAVVWRDGKRSTLAGLGGARSDCLRINEAGETVGWAETRGGERHACVWRNGTPQDLGAAGRRSEAYAINRHGDVVGQAADDHDGPHAVLWSAGKPLDLDRFVSKGTGRRLTSADAVSDSGIIVAGGLGPDRNSAYVLIPVREKTRE